MHERSNVEWNVTLAEFAAWRFEPFGDHVTNCSRGRGLARTLLSYSRDPGFQPALRWAMSAIAELDRPLSGVEIGFFAAISEALQTAEIERPRPKLVLIDGGVS